MSFLIFKFNSVFANRHSEHAEAHHSILPLSIRCMWIEPYGLSSVPLLGLDDRSDNSMKLGMKSTML